MVVTTTLTMDGIDIIITLEVLTVWLGVSQAMHARPGRTKSRHCSCQDHSFSVRIHGSELKSGGIFYFLIPKCNFNNSRYNIIRANSTICANNVTNTRFMCIFLAGKKISQHCRKTRRHVVPVDRNQYEINRNQNCILLVVEDSLAS